MTDLPVTTDSARDAVLVTIALLNAIPFSQALGGNVLIRGGWDVEEDIETPSLTATHTNQNAIAQGADGVEDEVTESIQIDAYAEDEAQVNNLKYEAEKIFLANRVDPGGAGANIFAFLMPGQWVNNDALNQAEGIRRRTVTVRYIRHRGTGGP